MFGADGGVHSKRLKYVDIFLAPDKISVVPFFILVCSSCCNKIPDTWLLKQ